MNLLHNIQTLFSNIIAVFADFGINDFVDIAFVALLIFGAIKLVRETRTVQLIKGLLLLAVVYGLVRAFRMETTSYLFSVLFRDFIIVIVVVFHPEIRHMMEAIGRSKWRNIFNFRAKSEQMQYNDTAKAMIGEVCRACADMSDRKIGALMVFEKESVLNEIVDTGTAVDAKITEELIGNVFFPKAPLHDGAAIVRNNRLCAAGCILPLTHNHNSVSSSLGTRHRAAIGMSEESDAVVVVVSEETGNISVATEGKLRQDISDGELREILTQELMIPDVQDGDSKIFKNKIGRARK